MSKAPNRYLILGVRHGHVKRLVGWRDYSPDEAIGQALLADNANPGGPQRLILIEIGDASDDIGAPLNTEVRIIEREKPTLPYRLVNLNRQELC